MLARPVAHPALEVLPATEVLLGQAVPGTPEAVLPEIPAAPVAHPALEVLPEKAALAVKVAKAVSVDLAVPPAAEVLLGQAVPAAQGLRNPLHRKSSSGISLIWLVHTLPVGATMVRQHSYGAK